MIIKRNPGDKPGDDIIDSLLFSPEAQIERGRQEINSNSTDRYNISGKLINDSYIRPGRLLSYTLRGENITGMVTSFSLSVSLTGKETTVNIESNI